MHFRIRHSGFITPTDDAFSEGLRCGARPPPFLFTQ